MICLRQQKTFSGRTHCIWPMNDARHSHSMQEISKSIKNDESRLKSDFPSVSQNSERRILQFSGRIHGTWPKNDGRNIPPCRRYIKNSESKLECDPNFPNLPRYFELNAPLDRKKRNSPLSGSIRGTWPKNDASRITRVRPMANQVRVS